MIDIPQAAQIIVPVNEDEMDMLNVFQVDIAEPEQGYEFDLLFEGSFKLTKTNSKIYRTRLTETFSIEGLCKL